MLAHWACHNAKPFQSTHSRGVRREHGQDTDHRHAISIHALTRSATYLNYHIYRTKSFQSTHSRGVRLSVSDKPSLAVRYFNPRTHEECDVSFLQVHYTTQEISIHALTRSATPAPSTMGTVIYFNPRTHEECDA
ncbi:Hypothetical protein TES5_192 [Trichococcus sp. ES5]|nr:Hypothetical protein TES5_192 [Trichococcus sp. ES5]